jgi:hypothetical protein
MSLASMGKMITQALGFCDEPSINLAKKINAFARLREVTERLRCGARRARKLLVMRKLRQPFFWLAIAGAALLAGTAGLDLRLIAGVACALAVLSGSGALDRTERP